MLEMFSCSLVTVSFSSPCFWSRIHSDRLLILVCMCYVLYILYSSLTLPYESVDTGHKYSYYAEIRSFGVPPGQDFRLEGAVPPDDKEKPEVRGYRLSMGDNPQNRGKPPSQYTLKKVLLAFLVFSCLWAAVVVVAAIVYLIWVLVKVLGKCCSCKKKTAAATEEEEKEEQVEDEDEFPNLDKFKTPSLASDATETSVVLINSELEYAEGAAPWEETDYSLLVQERGKKNPWKAVKNTDVEMEDTEVRCMFFSCVCMCACTHHPCPLV